MINSNRYGKTFLALITCVCWLSIGASEAAVVTWQITGSVFEVNPDLSSRFTVGDTLNANLTFDTTTPDDEPGVSYRGKYTNAANMIASISGYTGTADQMYITMINNFINDGSDRFLTSSTDTSATVGDSIGDYSFSGFSMYLRDDDGSMFSSIEIPTIPPSSSFFDDEWINLSFIKPIAANTYLGAAVRVNNLQLSVAEPPSPVPLPQSILLFASGLIGLFGIRKNKKSCP